MNTNGLLPRASSTWFWSRASILAAVVAFCLPSRGVAGTYSVVGIDLYAISNKTDAFSCAISNNDVLWAVSDAPGGAYLSTVYPNYGASKAANCNLFALWRIRYTKSGNNDVGPASGAVRVSTSLKFGAYADASGQVWNGRGCTAAVVSSVNMGPTSPLSSMLEQATGGALPGQRNWSIHAEQGSPVDSGITYANAQWTTGVMLLATPDTALWQDMGNGVYECVIGWGADSGGIPVSYSLSQHMQTVPYSGVFTMLTKAKGNGMMRIATICGQTVAPDFP